MTVNLTKIYTRLGDGGETHLGDMSRVPKTHPRIEAYGDIDELNSHVGVLLNTPGLPERYVPWLQHIQNDLFDLGADLSVPEAEGTRDRLRVRPEQTAWLEQRCDEENAVLPKLRSFLLPGGSPAPAAPRDRLRVRPEQTAWLEQRCDEENAELPKLRSFLLPGGSPAAAQLHVCRTVCRRAERRALLVDDANKEVVRYLNRLSDLFFILSRGANVGGEEPLWEPGRFQ